MTDAVLTRLVSSDKNLNKICINFSRTKSRAHENSQIQKLKQKKLIKFPLIKRDN